MTFFDLEFVLDTIWDGTSLDDYKDMLSDLKANRPVWENTLHKIRVYAGEEDWPLIERALVENRQSVIDGMSQRVLDTYKDLHEL